MDLAGQPHFTEDAYDDFYYGKGSTYPDINGSIGILFEQRAILGQEFRTSNGTETFPQAVANHLRMSLSSLQGSWAMREQLKAYQSGFYNAMLERARSRNFTAWLVGDDGDPARARVFLETLDLHKIEYQALAETVRAGSHEFRPGHAWLIPAQQRQFGLLEAMMEQRTRFEDNTFYDVSAWTLPLANNLPFATVDRMPSGEAETESSSGLAPEPDAPAWAVRWSQLDTPALLQQLLQAEVRVRTAIKPFSAQTGGGLKTFEPGTLVIQAGIQTADALQKSREILGNSAMAGLEVHSLDSTMTVAGPDLGARHFKLIKPVNPLIVAGSDNSSYGAGEQWFLLDHRLGIPTTLVEARRLDQINLWDYTHLLLADGKYESITDELKNVITRWVRDGGILVTINRAASWAESLCFEDTPDECAAADSVSADGNGITARAYSDFTDDNAKQVIGGAIVSTVLDLSHPIAFGYPRAELPIFRRGTTVLTPAGDDYSTPVRYTSDPLMAGFIGAERLAAFRGQAAVIAEKNGAGLLVRFANNPLFRGFWRGTEKLYINALYFGQVVESTELPKIEPAPGPDTARQQ